MATSAHQKGNTLYRNGDLEGAEKSYKLAHKMDPKDPKYASNLSAVYYEQGRYDLCIDAIMSSWKALCNIQSKDNKPVTPLVTDSMALKLALRFLKAQLTSLAVGLISLHTRTTTKARHKFELEIHHFCDIASKTEEISPQHEELRQVWDMWLKTKAECAGHTTESCQKNAVEAEKRLRSLPIYRSSLYKVCQYFRFGHDEMKSPFDAPNEMHQYSEGRIYELTMLEQEWKKISLLFGGFGDGRQVYATLIDFGYMWRSIRENAGVKPPDLHLTLFDIHPAAVARLMLIFALIRKSMSCPDVSGRLEIESTLFYLWTSVHVPAYSAKIIMDVSRDVMRELSAQCPRKLTRLWTVDEHTKARVLKIFEYWSQPLPTDTRTFFETNGPAPASSIASDAVLQQCLALTKERYNNLISDIRYIQGMRTGRVKGTAAFAEKDPSLPLYNNFDGDNLLFQDARILLPPKQLLSRHPALEKYVKAKGKKGKVEMREEVIREWKPNPTLFDNHTTENLAYTRKRGYPKISFDEDPSRTMVHILYFIYLSRMSEPGIISVDQTAFVIIQQMFDSVRKCLETLDSCAGALNLEFVCAELYSGLPKLIAGDLGPRPETFPRKYLRMWLSNTPDYCGGILSNIVYLAPFLEDTKFGMMTWNCLFNTASFASLKDHSVNYTYLTASGILRFFNCNLREEDGPGNMEFGMSVLPRTKQYSSLVSKKELHNYLSSILLRALCCPRSGYIPFQVDEPTNLVNFIRILVSLVQTFACPAHWVGDFVQSMVNDNLYTTAGLFDGVLPITQPPTPKKTERKLNLEPYQLELETILVLSRGALPFSIIYPERFSKTNESIKMYSATVNAIVQLPDSGEIGATFNTASLLFYKTNRGPQNASAMVNLPSRIPELVESKDGKVDGVSVQIVSSVEEMDFENRRVAWKMSEKWYERMKEEGWSMVVWVTNRRRTVSAPVAAGEWLDESN